MTENVGSSSVYSMGVAERLTGLTARQIRYWEQHGLLAPSRTKGRQRLYSEADILRLKEIKRLMADGLTMERVKAHLASKEAKRISSAGEMVTPRMSERIPTRVGSVGSLYGGGNRAELERMIQRKAGK